MYDVRLFHMIIIVITGSIVCMSVNLFEIIMQIKLKIAYNVNLKSLTAYWHVSANPFLNLYTLSTIHYTLYAFSHVSCFLLF